MVYFTGHRYEDIAVLAIGILSLAAVFVRADWLLAIGGLLFFITLPTSLFGRHVKIEGDEILLELGWPVRVSTVRIPLGDVVEVTDLETASGIPPIRYHKRAIIYALLWAAVGFAGLLREPSEQFMWLNWVFWGLVPLIELIFPRRMKLLSSLCLILVGVVFSLWAWKLDFDGYLFYAFLGVILAFLFNIEPSEGRRVVLVTRHGTYILSAYTDREMEDFLKALRKAYEGEFNAEAA